jgi:hypothetical protein
MINNLATPTTGEDRTRELIEQAATDRPYCEACGAATTPLAQGELVWLACTAAQEPRPLLRRILSFGPLTGHTRQLVLEDLSERLAA